MLYLGYPGNAGDSLLGKAGFYHEEQDHPALLEGREENHQLPFLWLHGEDEATLRQMMAVIHGASCRAVCLESRTHPDFCGPQWWHDVDIILEEAKARGMQVWILDDKHYPSGMANGALLQAPEELCRQNIFCNRLALGEEAGPVALSLRQAGLLEGPGPTQEDIRQGFLPGEPAGGLTQPETECSRCRR